MLEQIAYDIYNVIKFLSKLYFSGHSCFRINLFGADDEKKILYKVAHLKPPEGNMPFWRLSSYPINPFPIQI